jgi:hypothetical protein
MHKVNFRNRNIFGKIITLGLVCSLAMGVAYDAQACHRGQPHGKDTDCGEPPPPPPPPAGDVTLAIAYEFGVQDVSGACASPQCISTTINAVGSVECGANDCTFQSTSVNQVFGLPSSLRDLLFATAWRGTALNPDACFGSSATDPVGGALIDSTVVTLQRFHDGATPWYASVGTRAFAIDGIEIRQHIFNFEGCGANGDCGTFSAGSMNGGYEGGELIRIDSHGNDKKFNSVPCRCTRSNTPNCPDDVPSPTPPIRMTVSEVP